MENTPIDLFAWVDSVRPQLKPPVGNKLLFGAGVHKVMVVGGPNERDDFHIEEGEELFLQLEGPAAVDVAAGGGRARVPLPPGALFVLPSRVPHSPQRAAGTVGLVVERERAPGELDGLRWYVRPRAGAGAGAGADAGPGAGADGGAASAGAAPPRILYEEAFACTDLGAQLGPVIARFRASRAAATNEPAREYEADSPLRVADARAPPPPPAVDVRVWAAEPARAAAGGGVFAGTGAPGSEYRVDVLAGAPPAPRAGGGAAPAAFWAASRGVLVAPPGEGREGADAPEVFVHVLDGVVRAGVAPVDASSAGAGAGAGAGGAFEEHALRAGSVMLVTPGRRVRLEGEPGCLALVVTNWRFFPAAKTIAA